MTVEQIDLWLIVGYFVLVLLLGAWGVRKQSSEDFLAHGRSLNTWQFLTSVSASWIGGGAIVAYGAYVYAFGIAAVAVYVGALFCFLLFRRFAPAIREEGHRLKHLTLADHFSEHSGRWAGLAVAIVVGIGFFFFLVNQYIAGTTVLATISGWSYETTLLLSGGVVLVYLLLGGLRSVVRTDVFQNVAMLVLFVVLGWSLVSQTGVDPALLDVRAMRPLLLLAFLLYGLFIPFASPDIWQRIYAARDEQTVKRGLVGAGVMILVLGAAITLLGVAAKTAFPSVEPREAIPYGMIHLLPTGMRGLGLVVLFAAIMSSVDTIVFYLSTSVTKDILKRARPALSDAAMRSVTKGALVAVSILGMLAAFLFRDLIALVITLAGLQAALIAPILASFRWRLSQGAVIAALLASALYVIGLILFDKIVPEWAMGSLFVSTVVLGASEWGARRRGV